MSGTGSVSVCRRCTWRLDEGGRYDEVVGGWGTLFFLLFYAGFLGNCARPVIGPLLFLMPAAPGKGSVHCLSAAAMIPILGHRDSLRSGVVINHRLQRSEDHES